MQLFMSVVQMIWSPFIIIIGISLFSLMLDFLFPSFRNWTRVLLFLFVFTFVLSNVFTQFTVMQKIAYELSSVFLGVYPLLAVSVVASGNAFQLLNFQPAMLLFAHGAVFMAEKLLIPLLTCALVFDMCTRLLPEISFAKMADLIRTTLLGVVAAVVAAYSLFMTISGTMSWAISGMTIEPVKELIQRNIPFIGSFIIDSIGVIGNYTSGAAIFLSAWLLVTVWTIALLPTMKTLLLAFFYRGVAAFLEPIIDEDIAGLLDDVGKTLFVLCAVSFLLAFALIYTALFSIILIKLMTMR